MRRSAQRRELVIDSQLTLRRGARRVEVETAIDNTICDHRLRVLCPTGAQAQTFFTDTPFDVVERPIALRADNHLYRELEVEAKPQQSLCAVWDGQRGLALLSRGQPEVAVRDQADRPIALTLYRSTRRTVGTAGEPGGQLLQPLSFAYWLVPLAAAPDWADLCAQGVLLGAGLHDAQLVAADLPFYRRSAALPLAESALALSGPAVLTSLRQVGPAIEMRLFNPQAQPATIEIALGPALRAFDQVQRVNLESEPLSAPEPLIAGRLHLSLAAKEIITLSLSTAPREGPLGQEGDAVVQ